MGSRSEWLCWEIMQCKESDSCPASKNPEKHCWEIVRAMDNDYRSFFDVCRDCIVHVLKTRSPVLSNQEVMDIMKTRAKCRLACKNSRHRSQSYNIVPLPHG